MASRIELETDVQFVRGVGPFRAKIFASLGVRTVGDLVEYLPFRHALCPQSIPIGSLELDTVATVVGEFQRVRTQGGFGRQSVSAEVVDATGVCRVRWFNSPFLVGKLHAGQVVRLTGKVQLQGELAFFANPQFTLIDDDTDAFAEDRDGFAPVYPATAELSSKQIAGIVDNVLDDAVERVIDFVPESIRRRRKLPPRRTAILRSHRPTSLDDVPIARRRLAYDEFLLCQLAVRMSRERLRKGPPATPIVTTDRIDRRIRSRLPFELTSGQDSAVADIRADLARPEPMNRLLQADVGAGKTAVAIYAALSAIANRRQVAMLAPTEVLAAQHRAKVEEYLAGSEVRTEYLVGSTPKSKRARLLSSLESGAVDLLIGTHALLEKGVRFCDLGLVIIDEQHKFGVAQRSALRRKGQVPHTLVLTATPIPRTLAMTVFGDLDVSAIHDAPPGRKPIVTRLVPAGNTEEAWRFVRERLDKGEQAFIVYPLVEESETLPLKAARVEADRLAQAELAGCRIALLHGRMKQRDKDDVMKRFRAGSLDAVVATTVIEVGVDVPGATVMVIQHAERFGLGQLHQLRGRIGRGSKKSFCLLFTEGAGGESRERLNILCETTDGFRIAEEDLRLRGPGEMLGTRQHGLPTFRVANLLTDLDLLEQARDDAAAILRLDAELAKPQHTPLKVALTRDYRDALGLIDS